MPFSRSVSLSHSAGPLSDCFFTKGPQFYIIFFSVVDWRTVGTDAGVEENLPGVRVAAVSLRLLQLPVPASALLLQNRLY